MHNGSDVIGFHHYLFSLVDLEINREPLKK